LPPLPHVSILRSFFLFGFPFYLTPPSFLIPTDHVLYFVLKPALLGPSLMAPNGHTPSTLPPISRIPFSTFFDENMRRSFSPPFRPGVGGVCSFRRTEPPFSSRFRARVVRPMLFPNQFLCDFLVGVDFCPLLFFPLCPPIYRVPYRFL